MSTTREQMAAGAARPAASGGDFPDRFKFTTPGEELFGQVTRVDDAKSAWGTEKVIEVEDEALGAVALWVTNVQLKNAIVEGKNAMGRPVAVGDTVYIRYDGSEALEGGKTLKNYSVNVAPGTGTPPAAAPVKTDDVPF